MLLEKGFGILESNPNLEFFYPALASLCEELVTIDSCYLRFHRLKTAAGESIVPYIEYALGRTSSNAEARSRGHILAAAASPYLTPSLARRLVDQTLNAGGIVREGTLSELWAEMAASSSKFGGPEFGLAYFLVRSQEWAGALGALLELSAQYPEDPEPYRELARVYFFTGREEDCRAATKEAIERASKKGDLEAELISRGNLAYVELRWRGATDLAKDLLLKVVKVAEKTGDLSSIGVNSFRLGELEARRGNYSIALGYLEKAESLIRHLSPNVQSEIHFTMGEVLRRQFRYDEAEIHLNRADSVADVYKLEIKQLAASLYRSHLLSDLGRFWEAEEVTRNGMQVADSLGVVDSRISFRMSLGDILSRRDDHASAIHIYRAALDIAESDKSEWRVQDIVISLGRAYACIGNFADATRLFKRALEISSRASDSLDTAFAHLEIARIYNESRRFYLSKPHLHEALEYLRSKEVPRATIRVLQALAETSLHEGDIDAAGKYLAQVDARRLNESLQFNGLLIHGLVAYKSEKFQEAVNFYIAAQDASNRMVTPPNGWFAIYGEALSLWALDRRTEAELRFKAAVAELEQRRHRHGTALNRLFLATRTSAVFQSYATFLEGEGRFREALGIIERGRARSLVDLLYTTQLARGRSDGTTLEEALNAHARSRSITSTYSDPVLDHRGTSLSARRTDYAKAQQETIGVLFEKLETDLRRGSPLYTYSPVSPKAAQDMLQPHEVAIFYDLRGGTLLQSPSAVAYVVRPDSVGRVVLDTAATRLGGAIQSFRNKVMEIERGVGVGWETSARQLHEILMRPVLPLLSKNTGHIHIIPDGPLHYLPFAALLGQDGRFLVESFELSYAPSLTVLDLSRRRNARSWRSMLLLADPDNDLRGARHEASLIAAKWPNRTKLLLGSKVTKKILNEEVDGYDVLHLSTHASFHSPSPLASFVKLHDGILSVHDIGRLELNAYLVTLSACETALGGNLQHEYLAGEEWVGFHQAFLAAGTPTVLASSWRIHDRYSGPLMVRFYEQLDTAGKARALAEVQRSYIRTPTTMHPYYWAPFAVIGDPL